LKFFTYNFIKYGNSIYEIIIFLALKSITVIGGHFMEQLDDKLVELAKRIEEVREILNEACITSEDEDKTLFISQLLDDLIVEYFKVVQEDRDKLKSE